MVACRDAALAEKDAKIERLRKSLNKKPSREMAMLRLGFESAEREVGRLRKQVEELKVEDGKDLLREKEQLELRNASLRGQVDREAEVKAEFARMLDAQQNRFDERVVVLDGCLDKMVNEMDEEFAPMLRDAIHTKKWIVGQGFCYFLNKFKESELLRTRLGARIAAAIADGMRQGLEAGIIHGRKGTDINSILAYNPNATEVYSDALNALNDVPFPLLEQLEACAGVQFSYTKALLVMGVHESKQDRAGTSTNPADDGATATRMTPVEEVTTVESNFEVLAKIVSNIAALVTLASAPDVSTSGPSSLVIPENSPFQYLDVTLRLHNLFPLEIAISPDGLISMAASSLLSSKRFKLKRSPSSFLFLLIMEHLISFAVLVPCYGRGSGNIVDTKKGQSDKFFDTIGQVTYIYSSANEVYIEQAVILTA
ncbi:hypothetical protein Tco_0309613 [Tanacetum coccineum]